MPRTSPRNAALTLAFGSIALGLVACTDAPTGSTSAEKLAPSAALTLADGATYDEIAAEILAMPASGEGVLQSATGRVATFAPKPSVLQRYAFSAIRHRDGTVSGRFVVYQSDAKGSESMAQGEVECLSAKPLKGGDGTADVGGEVTHVVGTPGVFNLRKPVRWTVVDMGEDADDLPDLASQIELDVTDCDRTAPRPALSMFPTDNGNVQVHP